MVDFLRRNYFPAVFYSAKILPRFLQRLFFAQIPAIHAHNYFWHLINRIWLFRFRQQARCLKFWHSWVYLMAASPWWEVNFICELMEWPFLVMTVVAIIILGARRLSPSTASSTTHHSIFFNYWWPQRPCYYLLYLAPFCPDQKCSSLSLFDLDKLIWRVVPFGPLNCRQAVFACTAVGNCDLVRLDSTATACDA